jgi:hypothetical protein
VQSYAERLEFLVFRLLRSGFACLKLMSLDRSLALPLGKARKIDVGTHEIRLGFHSLEYEGDLAPCPFTTSVFKAGCRCQRFTTYQAWPVLMIENQRGCFALLALGEPNDGFNIVRFRVKPDRLNRQ